MSFDRSKKPTWRQGYRYQYEPAQKGHVLLYPEGMIKLNDSAALIGGLIDGDRDVAAIIAELDKQIEDNMGGFIISQPEQSYFPQRSGRWDHVMNEPVRTAGLE